MSLSQAVRAYRRFRGVMYTPEVRRTSHVEWVEEPGFDPKRFPEQGHETAHRYAAIRRASNQPGSARLVLSRRRDGLLVLVYVRDWHRVTADVPYEYVVFIDDASIRLRVMSRKGEHVHPDQLVPARCLSKLLERIIQAYLSNSEVKLTGLGAVPILGAVRERALRIARLTGQAQLEASALAYAALAAAQRVSESARHPHDYSSPPSQMTG